MKRLNFLFTSVFVSFYSFSQITFPLDTVIYRENRDSLRGCLYIDIFDTNRIVLFQGKYKEKNGSFLYINNKAIDSTGLYAWEPVCFGKEILFKTGNKNSDEKKLIAYNIQTKSFVDINYNFYDYNRDDYLTDVSWNYIYARENRNGLKLFNRDLISNEKKLIADFTSYIENSNEILTGSNLVKICDAFFINNDKIIVKIGTNQTAEGFEEFRYFLVTNNQIQEISDRVLRKKLNEFEIVESRMSFVSGDREFIREITVNYNSGLKNSHIVDNDYNFVSDILGIGNFNGFDYQEPIIGVNLQNKQIINYFLSSSTDKNKVIIPYKFIPALDIAMYKAYKNELLTKDELKDFKEYELGVLKNLIFAKYNYEFKSEFYQAYFNLYAFYNNSEMKNSRTKDVSDKLSEIDNQNLKLIKEMLK